jgi:hypothetical protein
MSVLVSVLVAGDGFTIVVLVSFFSVFSEGGLVTVVSFCSHAAKSAAPSKRQIYLFITNRTDSDGNYLRRRGRSRGLGRCRLGGGARGRFRRGTGGRSGGFSFLFASRK